METYDNGSKHTGYGVVQPGGRIDFYRPDGSRAESATTKGRYDEGQDAMTTVAIYARRSTEQNVSDEEKSVTRQIDLARAFAAEKGWQVIRSTRTTASAAR